MASKLIIIAVFILDIIAFGLAITAEQRRSKGEAVLDNQQQYRYCVYDSGIATAYGVGALVLLLASQVIVMAASKCFCCGRALHPGGSGACALTLFLFCWLSFITAEACLLAGSVRNAYHHRYAILFLDDPPTCETARKGVFAVGAAFVFFTAILSEFYYVFYAKSSDSGIPHNYSEASVGMSPYS